ncbi:MAG TPA: DinB family protein [Chloroflexota bacterium]|nr:DinB family protein [Chloroflexota bacterium]
MNDPVDTVRAVLAATPARWITLTAALPADLLARQPIPGEWSPLQCLHHLLATETLFRSRAFHLLAEEDFPAYDPDAAGATQDGGDPAAVAAAFAAARAESLTVLPPISEADLGRTARHAELGPVTLSQLLHEWAAHDLLHTVQAERALMQPFIRGCGPWRSYFLDHVAGD